MDVGHAAEEESVAGGGVGNAGAGHDGAVEADDDADGHGDGDQFRAPRPGDGGERGDGGARRGGDARGGEQVLDGRVGGHVEDADDGESGDERDGQAALRVLYFAGDHGEIVPAVVSPEGGDEGDHESAKAAVRAEKAGGEIAPVAAEGTEADNDDGEDEDDLQPGEDELEVACFADAEIVEAGDEPRGGDGEELRPVDDEGDAQGGRIEPVERGEDGHDPGEADGGAGDGGGLGDGKPRPHVEEGGQIAIGAADVDVFAASVGKQGAELGVGHGAEEGKQAAGDPREVDERRCAGGADHLIGNEKDAAADDGADDDGGGVGDTEDARQARRGVGLGCISGCVGMRVQRRSPDRYIANLSSLPDWEDFRYGERARLALASLPWGRERAAGIE